MLSVFVAEPASLLDWRIGASLIMLGRSRHNLL
jgi:hypothetical protein